MSLNQETLNNVGKASYQNRRVFWTSRGLSYDEIPDDTIAPNFHLPLSKTFPPPEGIAETCYIARVKRYCGQYRNKNNFYTVFLKYLFFTIATEATAKIFRDKFRAILPIRYTTRRQSEESTPPTSPTPNEQSDSEPNSTDANSIPFHETEVINMDGSNEAAQFHSNGIQNESLAEISND